MEPVGFEEKDLEEFEDTWTLSVWKSLEGLFGVHDMDIEGLEGFEGITCVIVCFDKHIRFLFGSSRIGHWDLPVNVLEPCVDWWCRLHWPMHWSNG